MNLLKISISNLKAIISHLRKDLSNNYEKIVVLINQVAELEKRVLECEKIFTQILHYFDQYAPANYQCPLAEQVCSSLGNI